MKEISYPGLPAPKEFLEGKGLIATLGKAEAEEVFGIILEFSYDANKWVAPTFDELAEALDKKVDAIKENAEAARRNATKRAAYEKKKKWAWLYRIIGRKLVEPEYEEVKEIFSIMRINPNAPVIGLRYMRDMGYLKIEDGVNKTHYAVLTQKALDTLK